MNDRKLKFGLPKGSLQDATIEKMAKAGFNIHVSSRSYVPYVDDDELEIRLIRAQEISRYVATKEPMDKAGAYGIQGLGGSLVAEGRGSYTNVVGLPLEETLRLLRLGGLMPQ